MKNFLFLKRVITYVVLFLFLISILNFFLWGRQSTFAEVVTSVSQPHDDSGVSKGNTTIKIREAFPGESNEIDVSKEKGSLNILSSYISSIFRFVSAISVIIAVLVLMTSGFMIMTAGGDSGARDTAKEWIEKTFMGLAFLFLAGLFLKTINPNFYIFGEKGGNNDVSNGNNPIQQEIEHQNAVDSLQGGNENDCNGIDC